MAKIAIVGTGSMGSVYAGLLAKAGNDVWAIDVDQEHVSAIQNHGLRVEGASGDYVANINSSTDPSDVGVADLIVIATKAMDAKAAALSAMPMINDQSLVLAIQNGIGSFDEVQEIVGRERALVGVAGGFGASLKAPGHVHHNGWEMLRLGEANGSITARLATLAELWRGAGFTIKCFDDIDRLIWEKLICNVCFSGICGLTDLTIGEVMADVSAWHVARQCASEAYDVAQAKDIPLSFSDPEEYVYDFGNKIPGARPSMLLDLMAGRPSEVDYINGTIARLGRDLGVSTPANELVTNLIKVKERKRCEG